METVIKQLKDLCVEISAWGKDLGMPQTHNVLPPLINIYFANNYKTWSVTIGVDNYTAERNSFEYTSYSGSVTIGENTTTELLTKLLNECANEFERIKRTDGYNLKERAEKRRKERIDSLKKELLELEKTNN